MKKVAIVNNWPHQYQGGIESYSRRLMEILLKEGWQVDEYATLKPNTAATATKVEGVNQFDISNGAKFYRKNATKVIKKFIKEDKYDLVIHNALPTNKSWMNDKVIFVQHIDSNKYSPKSPDWWFNFFNYFFLGIGYWRNELKNKNVVFFSRAENQYGCENPLYVPTPLQGMGFDVKTKDKGKYAFWMARHEEPHKGLKNLVEVSKSINAELVIGGNGPHTDLLGDLKSKCVGKIDKTDVKKYFDDAKVFLLTSNYEGFPITVVESLSRGIPVVMFDSFTSVEIVRKCPAVKIIKPGDYEAFIKAVNKIENLDSKEWIKLSNEATKFAKDNFSPEVFERKWIGYINKIVNKKD